MVSKIQRSWRQMRDVTILCNFQVGSINNYMRARFSFRRCLTPNSHFACKLPRKVWVGVPKLTSPPGAGSPRYATALTMTNLSFHGQRELSMGLQLQQKVQYHTAISNCCLTRSQVGENGEVIPPILDCKYSSVDQKLLWPRKTNYSIH